MKFFTIVSCIFLLTTICIANTPLDLLITKNTSRTIIDLTNIDTISAKNIDKSNDKLVKTERWQMPDIGYLNSYKYNVVQSDNETNTDAINNFLENSDTLPNSIGNNTNATNVSEIDTMPYY